MEITLDGDIRRVSKLLTDSVESKEAINFVYSFLDRERPPHSITYKHVDTIPKMVKHGLLTILSKDSHYHPSSTTTINEYPYYEISYQPEKLKGDSIRQKYSPNTNNNVDEILSWNDLRINISQATMQFKNNPSEKIPLGSRQFKFLIYLLRNRRVVEYVEYARYAKLNCYHENCENADVSRGVQYVKRDTRALLKRKGISYKFVDSMIVNVPKIGYKLADE